MKIPCILVVYCAFLLSSTLRAEESQILFQNRRVVSHDFKQGQFALFPLGDGGHIEIRSPYDVRWAVVRPLAAHVSAKIASDHRTVTFDLRDATPLTVEFNDDIAKVIHLFPFTSEKNALKGSAPHVKFFGPGVHEAGVIELASNETLYLAPGAWVKGVVRSIDSKNVRICGRGVLDGSDIPSSDNPATADANAHAQYTYGTGDRNMIYLYNVDGVQIDGITIFNSTHWTTYLRSCDHVHVNDVRVLNPSDAYGNDGFDVVSSRHVLIENVFVRTNDDCVVVKNLDDVDTGDVEVRNAVFWNMPTGGNGVEVGFELGHHPVSNLLFHNLDLIHVQRGSAISIHNGDDSTLSNVTFEDIRVEDVRRKLIDFGILYAQYGFDKPATAEERRQRMDEGGVWDGAQRFTAAERSERAKFRGHIRHVVVKGLHVVDGALPYSLIAGFDDQHAIEDVSISDLTYLGKKLRTPAEAKLVIEYAPGFLLR